MAKKSIASFSELKKEWIGSFQEAAVSDKAARQARFRNLQAQSTQQLQKEMQMLDQFYQSQFQTSLYDLAFEEYYFAIHPSDRPKDKEYVPYQMGKFHQVINNSLYDLKGFAFGFIGCLMSSLFIGAGTFVGAALRDLLALQKLYNTQNLSPEDLSMMRSYMYCKIRKSLNTQNRDPSQDLECQNQIALMLGLVEHKQKAPNAISNLVDQPIKNYARLNNLVWDDAHQEESQSLILAHYEQNYSWTKDFIKTLQTYCAEHPHLENNHEKWRFILTLAFPMRLLANRSLYLPDDAEVNDQAVNALKKDVITCIQYAPKECHPALKQTFRIDDQAWGNHVLDPTTDADFAAIAKQLLPQAEFKAPNPVLFSIFGKLQDNYAYIQEIQEARRNRPYQLGLVLASAAKEAALKTASVNYEYLMGSTDGDNNRSERHRLLTQKNRRG